MALGIDLFPDSLDFSFRTNPVRHAHDSQKRFSEEGLHPARAIGFNHLEFRIAQEREIQFELGPELGLKVNRVSATAQDDGIGLIESLLCVAKLGRFMRSAGCHCLGEEKKNDVLSLQVGQGNFLAVVRGQAERRGS